MPAGAPREAVTKVSQIVVKIMRAPDIRKQFVADGFDPVGLSPEEFSKYLRGEIVKWDKIIRAAGVKPQ